MSKKGLPTDQERPMIKIVHAADLYRRPVLAASMFRDRAAQFHHRLAWDAVRLDDQGLEFDQYDELNPVYVMIEDENGEHCGSGRMMPTTGRTMIAEHFSDITGGVDLRSPLIWEITRLCVSPRLRPGSSLARRAPAALLWAGCDLALRAGVEFCVAVFFAPMERVFKAAHFAPEIIGVRESPEGDICAGLWEITPEARDRLAARAGVDPETSLQYFPSLDRFPFRSAPQRSATAADLIDPAVAAAALAGRPRLARIAA
jgi:acyl homoserine lactone synthase